MEEDRGDKATQRAVLTFLLAEYPARHTVVSLWWMDFGDLEAVEEAVGLLDRHGLVYCERGAVAPTAAARHFDWLEPA
jgi:hypothetical protein